MMPHPYPKFTVNGVKLDERQNMALYVALQSFGHRMEEKNCMGDDNHGEVLREAYLASVKKINNIIIGTTA